MAYIVFTLEDTERGTRVRCVSNPPIKEGEPIETKAQAIAVAWMDSLEGVTSGS